MSELFDLWWSDWPSFLRMGRHGLYVWGSVAAVAAGLIGEQIALRRRARRLHASRGAQGSAR